VLVTHDVEEAVALADRVLVMDDGRWIREVEIPLPRPRLRTDPQFVRLRAELLEAILASGGAAKPEPAALELRTEAPQSLAVDTSIAAGV
jgi:sulfonate transport system ATP-binding protein